jgi:hypothetical protein
MLPNAVTILPDQSATMALEDAVQIDQSATCLIAVMDVEHRLY